MKANLWLLRWLCGVLLGLVLAWVSVTPSQARMGGGHSYSGGSSSSSSRSSGSSSFGRSSGGSWGGGSSGFSTHSYGGGFATGAYSSGGSGGGSTQLLEIILLIVVIYVLWRLLSQGGVNTPGQTFQSLQNPEPANTNIGTDAGLRDLLARDENFSKILFLDFASLLYHKVYTYRGTDQFLLLNPYLSKSLTEEITGNAYYRKQRIHAIVIGQAHLLSIRSRSGQDFITVEFAANMSLHYQTGEQVRLANREQWLFGRKQGVLSPQPAQMRALSCPSCGAPADFSDAGQCQYCHTFIQAGEKQWQVVSIKVINTEPFKTEDPGGYVEETGTNLPTLTQTDLQAQEQRFVEKHGLSNWTDFIRGFREQVVKPYFLATYSAWSQGQWHLARHLVSDRLYESNGFWLQEYARQGWHNRLENIQIGEIQAARLDLDKFYESITVRVFAVCLDYTVDKPGKVIGGSNKKPRKFSEYWTFIRTAGAEKIEAVYDLKTCPSCGAPADKIGQAGDCGYCGSKLTEGHFSWVLALITQDEAYQG